MIVKYPDLSSDETGGQLVDILKSYTRPLPLDLVLRMFYQTCRAVQHMHRQKPPIIHRDLKVCFKQTNLKG